MAPEVLLPPDPGPPPAPPERGAVSVDLSGATMGTGWKLKALVPRSVKPARIETLLQSAFRTVISQMSQWEPASLLSRYNAALAGTRFSLPPQFAIVLDCALGIARASGGAFDPTLGGLSEQWGFGVRDFVAGSPPNSGAQNAGAGNCELLQQCMDHDELVQPGGLKLDFSGIAKGFAVDLGLSMLAREGVHHALLEVGGEVKGVGLSSRGTPWWVDLEREAGSRAAPSRIGLSGWAAATTGHWHRRRSASGISWSHTLDPGTRRPVSDDIRSVSVLHRGCMQADALATAIAVLGIEEGIAFADQHGVPAEIVTRAGARGSAAWRQWRE